MRQLHERDKCMKLDKVFEFVVCGVFCGFGVFFIYWLCELVDAL